MKCPNCDVDLQARLDRGVEVEACPDCEGMWLTPAELDQLENEAFDDEANKGSLFLVTQDTNLKCPECSALLKRFNYRFFDLELDFCPGHGFWLEKDEDNRILELMAGEESRMEHAEKAEDKWARRMNHLRSPTFFSKLEDLLNL